MPIRPLKTEDLQAIRAIQAALSKGTGGNLKIYPQTHSFIEQPRSSSVDPIEEDSEQDSVVMIDMH